MHRRISQNCFLGLHFVPDCFNKNLRTLYTVICMDYTWEGGERGIFFLPFTRVVNGIADYIRGQVIRTKIRYIQWKGKPQSTRLLQLLHTTLWSGSAINLRFMKRLEKEVRTSSYRACICGLHLDSPILWKWCTVSISILARFPNSKCHTTQQQTSTLSRGS